MMKMPLRTGEKENFLENQKYTNLFNLLKYIALYYFNIAFIAEDIGVAESFQIHKVLHSNIVKASEQTRSLLSELRKDKFDEEDAADRAMAIDKSRRELQKLLKIVQ